MHFLLIFSFCFVIQFNSSSAYEKEMVFIPPTKTPPSSREGMAIASFKKFIAVFGGFSGRDYYNDLWLFNIPRLKWSEIYPASDLNPCNF